MGTNGRATILLIDPPYYRLFKDTYSLPRYPLSLGYLAAVVRSRTDWKVVAYNADFLPDCEPIKVSHLAGPGFARYRRILADPSASIWQEIAATIARYRPTVVGISCKSQTFGAVCVVARLAKRVDPAIRVVVGGPGPSLVPEDVMRCSQIDLAVRGEGEETIVRLLWALRTGASLRGIAGLVFREAGRVVANPPAASLEDLDALPFPHEHAAEVLHGVDRYPPEAFSHVLATRGCPFRCLFCGSRHIWGRRVRFRSARNVAEQIASLQRRGVQTVHFDDDTFGIRKDYIARLCEELRSRCPQVRWSCEMHVNLVEPDVIRLMKSAGCERVQLGIESGSDAILRSIRKGFTIDRALRAVEVIRRQGLEVETFFMVGLPDETRRTLAETMRVIRKLDGRVCYSIFTPYPGTEAYELCKARGLIGPDFDVALHNHQSPKNCFCSYLSADEFRRIVSKIERMVDRKNCPSRLRRALRRAGLGRMTGAGLGRALRRARVAPLLPG